MSVNSIERKLKNISDSGRRYTEMRPSTASLTEGEEVISNVNGIITMYRKQNGNLYKINYSSNGRIILDEQLVDVKHNLKVSKNLTVKNDLTVEGELKGTRLIFNFGTATASDTDFYMKTVNGVTMSLYLGYVMHRAGSIVGAGARFQCTPFSSPDTWSVDVLVNNSSVFKPTGIYVYDTGYYSTYGTQARGTDTFVVGNLIQVKMNATAGSRATIVNVIGYFEVVFDD